MIFGLAALTLQKPADRRALMDYFLVLCGVYALDSIVTAVERIYHMGLLRGMTFRIFVFHRHPNYTIFLMIMVLPLVLAGIGTGGKPKRSSVVVLVTTLFYLIVYSYSREGWLLLVFYGLSLLLYRRRRSGISKMALMSVSSVAVLGILIWRFKSITSRLESILRFSQSVRIQAWRVFWELHKDQPALGYGMGTDRYIYPQALGFVHPMVAPTRQFLYETHNAYMEILVGAGIIGLILFILFLITATGAYLRRQSGIGRYLKMTAAAVWFDLFFNYRFHATDTGLFLTVILALLTGFAPLGIRWRETYSRMLVKPVLRVATGIAVAAVVVCSGLPWLGRWYVGLAQHHVARGEWPAAKRYFSRAAAAAPSPDG
jgi:O-antigen ligase